MEWKKSSWLIVFLLFLAAPYCVYSEGPIEEDKWEALRKDLNYAEVEEPKDEGTNPGAAFLRGFLGTLFSSSIMVFGSILILALVAFLIYLLIKHSGKVKLKTPLKNVEEVNPDEPDSRSSYQDLWDAFNKAKVKNNYRECIRIFHQICIKNLSEAGLLQIHPDKTNWEYVAEISSNELANDFSKLTAEHELIWYGNSPIDESGFKNLEVEFTNFLKAKELEK